MKFTKDLICKLNDSGQSVCIYSKVFSEILDLYGRDSFSSYSSRSYYLWKNLERSVPVEIVWKVMNEKDIDELDIEYFSIKGGGIW